MTEWKEPTPELPPLRRVDRPRWLKATVDRLMAGCGIVVVGPFGILIAVAIVLEDLLAGRGWASPLYAERRSADGTFFPLLKFRVLRPQSLAGFVGADGQGMPAVKAHERDQDHTTRMGALLQRYYMDELPQLWNILAGHMSFVGPRPVPRNEPNRLALIANSGMRGGLTGVFQLAKGTECETWECDTAYYHEFARRGQLSLLRYDLGLIARTFFKVGRGEGL